MTKFKPTAAMKRDFAELTAKALTINFPKPPCRDQQFEAFENLLRTWAQKEFGYAVHSTFEWDEDRQVFWWEESEHVFTTIDSRGGASYVRTVLYEIDPRKGIEAEFARCYNQRCAARVLASEINTLLYTKRLLKGQ